MFHFHNSAKGDVFPYCLNKYKERCLSPIFKTMLDHLYIDGLHKNFQKFCKKGNGTIRESEYKFKAKKNNNQIFNIFIEFLRNANCIIHKVKLAPEYRNKCIRDLLLSLESGQEKTKTKADFLKYNCCPLNRWNSCILSMIKHECGEEAAEAFPNLIDNFYYGLLSFCTQLPQYHPNNPENVCSGTMESSLNDPKGLYSNSLGSYTFSYSCPNVGYGII